MMSCACVMDSYLKEYYLNVYASLIGHSFVDMVDCYEYQVRDIDWDPLQNIPVAIIEPIVSLSTLRIQEPDKLYIPIYRLLDFLRNEDTVDKKAIMAAISLTRMSTKDSSMAVAQSNNQLCEITVKLNERLKFLLPNVLEQISSSSASLVGLDNLLVYINSMLTNPSLADALQQPVSTDCPGSWRTAFERVINLIFRLQDEENSGDATTDIRIVASYFAKHNAALLHPMGDFLSRIYVKRSIAVQPEGLDGSKQPSKRKYGDFSNETNSFSKSDMQGKQLPPFLTPVDDFSYIGLTLNTHSSKWNNSTS